jgi:hypothetical protein
MYDWRYDTTKPVAIISCYRNGYVNKYIKFDASLSTDDIAIVEYLWDLDGDGIHDTKGKTIRCVYSKSGVYNLTLTVVDSQGNRDTATCRIVIMDTNIKNANANQCLIVVSGCVLVVIFYIVGKIWTRKNI